MKAVLCKSFGPPDSLVIEDIESPQPADGEVVIRVRAAALNFFDTLIIEGKYQFRPDFPFSPGAEVAGTIETVGSGVSEFREGDRVLAYTAWNGAREEVVANTRMVAPIPDGIDFETAAGLSVTYGTTLYALKNRAAMQPGETLAVLGAAGGTGQSAIEIGKVMGARVIACASSDDKLAFCRDVGADDVINYSRESLKDRLRELTDGRGADVVYDPVGGDLSEQAVRSTAWDGRFLVIGFAAGDIPRIPLNLILLRNCALVGVFWGTFTERDPGGHKANMSQLLDWTVNGKIKPHVHATYPLTEAVKALNAIARREVMGKVILVP